MGRHDLLRIPTAQQKLLKELRAFAETTKRDLAKAESNILAKRLRGHTGFPPKSALLDPFRLLLVS